MAILSIIRRGHLRDDVSLRDIAKRLNISRNTVRRYIRAGTVLLAYPERISPSKLDGFATKLADWLKTKASRPRKQRRSLKQIHADLTVLGFTGSYDRVAAFARRWRQEQQELGKTASRGTFVPLRFSLGEAFQFDWSEDWALINGERTKLQVAHFKLSHSRAFFLRTYPLQTHEMLFDAHYYAFVAWGGIPRRGIYDNMKTAVDKTTALFDGTVDAPLADAGPWLIDVEQATPSMHTALYTLASGPTGISWLISAYSASSLAQELRTRLDVRMPDGRTAVLRFYDARIVRNIAALLSSSQRAEFFVPTFDWITQINDRLTRVESAFLCLN